MTRGGMVAPPVEPLSRKGTRPRARPVSHSSRTAMDAAYLSVFAALAGSAVGGLTSLTNSWLTQHAQARAQQRAHEKTQREDLYVRFIDEAARLYADDLQHQTEEPSALVGLFALISAIRLVSSSEITKLAEQVAHAIVEAYRAPNQTFREFRDMLHSDAFKTFDPLRAFSSACHQELRPLR